MREATLVPHYAFSEKYDIEHARNYFEKHHAGLRQRLTNWREQGMARQALAMAGRPRSVLDLPCGTGRFWEVLAEEDGRRINVADNSRHMLDVGLALRSPQLVRRLGDVIHCSAFDTGLPDDYVECVFCFRLLHHIDQSADRVRMLKEFARISSGTVIVSLWVDGNYRAFRHRIKRARQVRENGPRPYNRHVVRRADIEADFAAAGLSIVGHMDLLKFWEKWRVYVLSVG